MTTKILNNSKEMAKYLWEENGDKSKWGYPLNQFRPSEEDAELNCQINSYKKDYIYRYGRQKWENLNNKCIQELETFIQQNKTFNFPVKYICYCTDAGGNYIHYDVKYIPLEKEKTFRISYIVYIDVPAISAEEAVKLERFIPNCEYNWTEKTVEEIENE